MLNFSESETENIRKASIELMKAFPESVYNGDFKRLRRRVAEAVDGGFYHRDAFGINPIVRGLENAVALCSYIAPDRNMAVAILIFNAVRNGFLNIDIVREEWGDDVARMINGLIKVSELYKRTATVQNENFRNLLLTFAEDIRVIILMIVDRFVLMRAINHHPDQDSVKQVALEANYLYAPLAHRLGLYQIKSALEDMSLKYNNRDIYTRIARKLNETKASREAYIADFIAPVKEKLTEMGLKFDIKGRTKSIYSIWNKMKKQKNDLEGIYDLFAIRIIIDSEPVKEKSDCWLAFSVVTDMFTPNPARMKDWISIPKSNGYESLHTTVRGPEGKWVEVQIRTRRMDLIAEKGLAAHWKYKGIRSEGNLDAWMNNVRDILETADNGPMELMRNMRMDVYDKEVFVFTPKGDLFNLPMGASVLDMAFAIHTGLGVICTGARVNGKNQKINYKLQSGDTVEILTSQSQQPKHDWLNFVVTSKARNKIRISLKEAEARGGEIGKELLQRRCKNRKVEIDEAAVSRICKKLAYKTLTDFYIDIASGKLDVNNVIETHIQLERKATEGTERISADSFVMHPQGAEEGLSSGDSSSSDVVVIGQGIKGVNYRLAKCCNPIYGDDVFGFVSATDGIIKIHRTDCPNSRNIKERYPYRIIKTAWSGKIGAQFGATIRIVGRDDIGIVTNITSIINKEKDTTLRNISIESHDGIFNGFVVVGVNDQASLTTLIRKLRTVKGVKEVQRY